LYYLKAGGGGTNWGIASDWNTAIDGSGTNASAMAGNDFNSNGRTFGTPSGNATFPGASLTLNGGTLNLRNGGTKTLTSTPSTSPALTTVGTVLITANSPGTGLTVNNFVASAGSVTTFQDLQGVTAVASTQTLTFTTLSGDGDFSLSAASGVNPGGSKTFLLTVASGSGYTGDLTWTGANATFLQFGNSLTLGGGLIANNSNSRITLDQNVTLASAIFNGTSLNAGTYSFATLNSLYDTIFADGGTGSITISPVPEPSTVALLAGGLGALIFSRRRTTRSKK
jgi:hypothetical protein